MSINYHNLRLDGIYKQNEQGQLMLRTKVPAGVLSSEQALKIADIADRYAGGRVHLTTRGSVEFHDLDYNDLPEVTRGLAAVGLTSRGACGGAVRGIACSSTFCDNFILVQKLVRKLHRHFVGNPYFEGLPKKFKIGVDGDYKRSRHLIQDVGLVHVGSDDTADLYDVWMAGGLGREPMAGLLFGRNIPEGRLIPIIEEAIRVFKKHGEQGKRLKHLVARIGEAEFRNLLREETRELPDQQIDNDLGQAIGIPQTTGAITSVTFPVFAGELPSHKLRTLGELSDRYANRFLALTADQDVTFFPQDETALHQLKEHLREIGLNNNASEQKVIFRICPGNHECRMGLAATRDIARDVVDCLSEKGTEASWAISGCSNSCSQPQLADYGIIARKSVKDENGDRSPRFELTRRDSDRLGEAIATDLDQKQLLALIREQS